MKKIFPIIFAGAALLSLASCVTSLQPVVTRDKIITDNRITGNWAHNEGTIRIIPFMQSDLAKSLKFSTTAKDRPQLSADEKKDSIYYSKIYLASFEKNGVSYNMMAQLIKLNGELFMDLCPATINDPKAAETNTDVYTTRDYLPGYTIAKVEMNGASSITLRFVDGDFIKNQIRAGNMRLKHEANDVFGTFIITASPQELQLFLQKYAADQRIFNKQTTISLTRKPSHT